MPKLLIFAPCEKVIISQDENNPTLIAIINQFGGEYQAPSDELPDDAKAPIRWSVFTLWLQQPGDETERFQQRIRFVSPAGRIATDRSTEFKMEKHTHRVTLHVSTLPLTENGTWRLELYVHKVSEAMPDNPEAVYPIDLSFKRKIPVEQ